MDLPWDIIVLYSISRCIAKSWIWVKYRKKLHYHVVQMLFFHWTIWIWGIILIIYRPGARGIRWNIITEGNISPNPPSGGSINDILYRKLKASKLRIKNLTHTFVNTMFYFRINASIVAFLSIRISFGILMTKPQVLGLKKPQVLGLKLKYSSLISSF